MQHEAISFACPDGQSLDVWLQVWTLLSITQTCACHSNSQACLPIGGHSESEVNTPSHGSTLHAEGNCGLQAFRRSGLTCHHVGLKWSGPLQSLQAVCEAWSRVQANPALGSGNRALARMESPLQECFCLYVLVSQFRLFLGVAAARQGLHALPPVPQR